MLNRPQLAQRWCFGGIGARSGWLLVPGKPPRAGWFGKIARDRASIEQRSLGGTAGLARSEASRAPAQMLMR
jgi:hypothetical protein